MSLTRRVVLAGGGGVLALAAFRLDIVAAAETVEITMGGTPDGGHVWFDPVGVHIQPGQSVRWINRDRGNSHTATAYASSPGRPKRVPDGAAAWDSGYLLPDDSFEVALTIEGVYDYFCVPHEHAGMVGRIVVGSPPAKEPYSTQGSEGEPVPEAAAGAFPSVADILAKGEVRRS